MRWDDSCVCAHAKDEESAAEAAATFAEHFTV